MKRLAFVLICVLSITICSSLAWSKSLYVDHATGNDSYTWAENDSAHKWQTLTRACSLAVAGDTVYVSAGTYSAAGSNTDRTRPAFKPTNSGTAGNPITFQAVGTVNLTLNSGTTGPVYGTLGTNYIVWDGFTTNEADHGWYDGEPALVWTSDTGITIKNGEFYGTNYTLIERNRSAIRLEGCNSCIVENNLFSGLTAPGDENNADIYLYYSTNITIQYNTHQNGFSAIWVKGGNNTNITYRYNLIYNASSSAIRFGPASRNSQIYQNIVYDSQFGIRNDDWTGGSDEATNTWTNNTIVNSTHSGIVFHCDTTGPSTFRDNLIVDVAQHAYYTWCLDVPPADYPIDYNMYHGVPTYIWSTQGDTNITFPSWQSTYGKDVHGSITDPLFVDKANHNYKLQAGSPARTASSTGGPVGAYITGNETIGRTLGGVATKPVLLSPIDLTTATWPVDFNWTGVTGAVAYHIQVDNNVGFDSPEVNDDAIDPDTACDAAEDCHYLVDYGEGLLTSTHYFWRVRAKK